MTLLYFAYQSKIGLEYSSKKKFKWITTRSNLGVALAENCHLLKCTYTIASNIWKSGHFHHCSNPLPPYRPKLPIKPCRACWMLKTWGRARLKQIACALHSNIEHHEPSTVGIDKGNFFSICRKKTFESQFKSGQLADIIYQTHRNKSSLNFFLKATCKKLCFLVINNKLIQKSSQ